jgi:hypothetical protein
MKFKRRKINLCECGCGRIVKTKGHRFYPGHVNKGKKRGPMSQEQRDLISVNLKKFYEDNPQHRDLISVSTKAGMDKKEVKIKMRNAKLGTKASEKTKEKMSVSASGKKKTILHRKNIARAKLGTKASEKQLEAQSKALKKLWQNPEYKDRQLKAIYASINLVPNKPETIIQNLLEEMFPSEWKFTGDFSFMISGKSPDFANINGQKKLIELFGDYWHRGENPQDRIDMFKPFGWDTLVIWEKELKDIQAVKEKIIQFHLDKHLFADVVGD